MTPIECSTLARTFDLVRFFARSISSTTPRWRYRRFTKSCARGACWRITARWPAVRLVAPHAGFVPVQQMGQHGAVGDIGRRRHHRVDQLASAVDPQMPLHPGRTFLWKIKTLEIEWESFCFAVSHTFSK